MKRLLLALALAATHVGCHRDASLDVAPNVDLARFQGKWFEVAKLPRATQLSCSGTTAFYTLQADGSLAILNECKVASGTGTSTRAVNARGKVPDPAVPAKLSVDFGSGFWGDYWILEVGDAYEYAVVGHPTRDYLWILSRTPELAPDKLSAIVSRAQANQFDTSRLEYTPQP